MGLARQIQLLNDNDKGKIREQCALLPSQRAAQCVWDAAQAAYIYGERASSIFSECDSAAKNKDAEDCYRTLFGAIGISYSSDEDRLRACATIPKKTRQDECALWVKSPEAAYF